MFDTPTVPATPTPPAPSASQRRCCLVFAPRVAGAALASSPTNKLEWELVGKMLPYAVPDIQDNPDGWGPCTVPEHLKDLPFAPFSKSDKLGRAADWTQQAYQKYQGATTRMLQ